MEDKIIVAVCSYPVLYDTSSPFYRDRNKKVQAWTKVSQVVGLPVDVCRKKWKGLRDVYLRERKKEAGPVKRWRFFAIMSFLDPFVTPILSSDNMAQAAEEDMTTEGSIDVEVEAEDEVAVAATAATTATTTAATTAAKTAAATAAATAVTAAVTAATAAATAAAAAATAATTAATAAATAAAAINDQFSSDSDGAAPAFTTVTPVVARTLSATQRRKRRRIKLEDESEGETQREERIEQLQEQSLRAPHQSEEEHFLLSLVPSLQRLPPHRRDYIKLQMCKIIHEENSALTHDMKFLE